MKYFALETSLDKKILGYYPQIKSFVHHCDILDEAKFIDKFIFEKIEIEPVLSNVVLHQKSKLTDFIDAFGDVGFNFGYLISDNFKNILDKFNSFGFQFFKTYVIQNQNNFENYWQTNIYDFPFHFIDFAKTSISLKDGLTRKIISECSDVKNLEDFENKIDTLSFPYSISISNIHFNENMNLDFFVLRYTEGGQKGIISERLKNELEKNEISGLEFRPMEIDHQEWLQGGYREKVYGKSI
jgi:hypothetical protein